MYNNNALSEMHNITHTGQAGVQFSLAYPYRLTVKKQRDILYIHRASSVVSAAMVSVSDYNFYAYRVEKAKSSPKVWFSLDTHTY